MSWGELGALVVCVLAGDMLLDALDRLRSRLRGSQRDRAERSGKSGTGGGGEP